MHEVKVSVRNLVEFILRNGDIDQKSGVMQDAEVMQAGSRAHRKLQKAGGINYQAEVSLKRDILIDDDLMIRVEGRADGIILDPKDDAHVIIDEIKGTFSNLDYFEEAQLLHQAQADCYACIYAGQQGLDEIDVQITYIHLETEDVKRFKVRRTAKNLEEWFMDIVKRYGIWARWQIDWEKTRQASIASVRFPFPYRDSQKRMMNGVYRAIEEGRHIFIQAPTGTGKTLGTLFPAIKAMGEKKAQKIFYLTAKTVTRTVAQDGVRLLTGRGLRMKTITLTAKEKICPMDECVCQPEYCQYAKGHFDRVNDAIYEIICHEDEMDQETLLKYAMMHSVCPFEFQLDVSLWCDTIICDYNYAFDPTVALKRYFADPMDGILFLVDEAHNLVDRAREMYSAVLIRKNFDETARILRGRDPKLVRRIKACGRAMEVFEEERMAKDQTSDYCEINSVGGFVLKLMRMVSGMEDYLKEEMPKEVRDQVKTLFFDARNFINTFDVLDDRYVIYTQGTGADCMIRLFCVDPSVMLTERTKFSRSTVFFSATLLPVQYYKSLLSAAPEKDYEMYVDSPFDPSHRLIVTGDDVSSRYNMRGPQMYEKISACIGRIIQAKPGNYMVFCPSYAFMDNIFDTFAGSEMPKAGRGLRVFRQKSDMDETERMAFLENFTEDPRETVLGFCVLGGVFSEGIDLKADRLIGAIIVGTGLPGVGSERELLKQFFDRRDGSGFAYAYLYPGLNKVFQAGGRVIRSEADEGVIALLDERFNYRSYSRLFPREWYPRKRCSMENIGQCVEDFWTDRIKEK